MSAPTIHWVVRGEGPLLLLVHGSAADADSWTSQLAVGSRSFRMVAHDRRGTSRSVLPEGADSYSVAEHAKDILALAEEEGEGRRPVLVGSSFGAVCALEAARRAPEAVAGLVLIEPPLPESDQASPIPESFIHPFRQIRAAEGGPASGAFFLRTVLGEAAFEAMPQRWQERACSLHEQIRLDCDALLEHRPDYAGLRELDLPVLLVGGGRSAPWFRQTLRALERTLPKARLEIIASAGHMLHAEAARSFHRLLLDFVPR